MILLALLSLGKRPDQNQSFPLPTWVRGLGWSAFSLSILVAGQALLGSMLWKFVGSNNGITPPFGFAFLLPRLVFLLPLWVFVFPACVMGVGALWATVFAVRRARGDASFFERLKSIVHAPDDRVGVVNLEPLVQIVVLVGAWGLFTAALWAWFVLPQQDALKYQGYQDVETAHQQYAGLALGLFYFAAIFPTWFYRVSGTKFSTYWTMWREVTRRFLVAHIALATTLYLLLSIAGNYWDTHFEAQWLRAHPEATLVAGQN